MTTLQERTDLRSFRKYSSGQGLIEAIIAMAVFALFAAGLTAMAAGSLAGLEQGGEYTQATELAQEGIEAVKSIREEAWNDLVFDQSGVQISSDLWKFIGASTTEQLGQFTRTITFTDVCRNGADDIVDCPGIYNDVHTKQVRVAVSWETRPGVTNVVNRYTFVTNWDSDDWVQTDWSGGSGQSVWSDDTQYDNDDGNLDVATAGQVILASTGGGGGCGTRVWPLTSASNYTFDSQDIEISGGNAQLTGGLPSGWWNANYSNRSLLTVGTGATAPQNRYDGYTVRLTGLDTATIIGAGDMQSDCDDLRITYGVGSSVEIDREIVGCNSSNTEVRFKLQADIADSTSSSVYYMYYGYDAATSGPSNLNNVYLWHDDATADNSGSYTFGRCDAWHGTGYTAWSYDAVNGYYINNTGDNFTGCFRYPANERDAYIEMEMYHTGCYPTNMSTGLFGRYILGSGSGSSESASHYYASSRAHNSSCGGGYTHDGDICEGGRCALGIDGTDPSAISTATWRKQGLALWGINNTNAKFWDADSIAGFGSAGWPSVGVNASGTDNTDQESAGDWGVIAAQDNVRVRNILLRRYTEPEPTVSLGTEESGEAYPSDEPSIYPSAAHEPSSVDQWISFSETASKDGGEVYYQLSDDTGSTWYYWGGTSWDVAGAAEYNAASVVNANITSFSTSSASIMFKAFLESDGTQFVQLDEVRLGCEQRYSWDFIASSSYSFDTGIEVTSSYAQLIDVGESGESVDHGFDSLSGTSYSWPFTTPSNYSYDSGKIDVTGGVAQLIADPQVFRIKEYYLGVGIFSGTSYDLTLDQNLADNYFVLVQGSDGDGSGNGNRGPGENYAALTADPNGTGDLSASGAANTITISRNNAVNDWVGVVTVVECLTNCDVNGFELLDVQNVTHSGGTGSGTDTSASSWSDVNQAMLMGGFNGAGCSTAEASNGNHDVCHVKIWPSGSDTINWERNYTGNTAVSTVMVLEWGSGWNVQRVNITGTAGGNGADATGEYNTAAISSVARDSTWVWGTGYTTDDGIGDAAEGTLLTLGDGVNQNASETLLAAGQEYNDNKNFEVYALTHNDLSVDYRFKTDGDSGLITYDQTVDTVSDDSARMAIVTNGTNGTGTAYPRPMFSARYTADDTVRLERRRSGQNFPAWVQGINFSSIEADGIVSWPYRKLITIDNTKVSATLTDFPVLIHFSSDADLAAKAQADADDIYFTSSNGTTQLSHEIESYDAGTGELVAWVKIPSLSGSADTDIYMYYGNASASNQEDAENVWDANYISVWHMNQDPTGSVLDSTLNSNDMTSAGGMTSGDLVDCQVGTCINFDGTNDYLYDTSPAGYGTPGNYTMSAWFVNSAQSSWSNYYSHTTVSSDYDPQWVLEDADLAVYDGGGIYGDTLTVDNAWHRLDVIRTGTTVNFYIDGIARGSGTHSATLLSPTEIYIANSGDTQSEFWSGELDEIRYSETNRSLNWIQTEYENQNSPSTFYTVGSELPVTALPTGVFPSDNPSINPTTGYTGTNVVTWNSFTEVASKGSGEIYYQISDDDGTTWYYWGGANWDAAGATDYSTASVVNTNIASFSTSTQKVSFKAFLESDGTEQIQLDDVSVGFTPEAGDWIFNTWDVNGGEVTPTGEIQASGGNPDGYANLSFPEKKNDEVGGFWEQTIVITENNPTATLDLDWIVTAYETTPDTFQIYAFVDSASGEPTLGNQVWASGEQTGTTAWASASTVDISSSFGSAGTYYLKIGVWLETDGGDNDGPYTVGFDNVDLQWSKVSYPTNTPSIQPASTFSGTDVEEWTTFTEFANTNGGSVYYQLSADGGSTWQYWNSGWVTSTGGTDYSSSSTVSANITSFPTSTSQIMFKAFLESDGTQQVQLDTVQIRWGEAGGGSGFATTGYLISSAFNTASSSEFQIIEWDENIPGCTPDCEVRLQVRAAPDSGGLPGTWTGWYGESGLASYFTTAGGTLIPNALNGNQWVQYRAELIGDGVDTPILEEVRFNYK